MRKFISQSLVIILTSAMLVALAVAAYKVVNLLLGVDNSYIKKMESIKIGMTEQDVIDILGPPGSLITAPEVFQYHGDPKLYGKAIKNRNKVLVYHHGVDISAHYFLDEKGKVFFVNVGGT